MSRSSDDLRRHKEALVVRARGQWADVLAQLGVPDAVLRKNKQQPCPRCRAGTDRFAFTDKFENGDAHCRKCGHMDGFDLAGCYGVRFVDVIKSLEARFGIRSAGKGIEPRKPPVFERVWNEAQPVTKGDPVWRYLRGRGLSLSSIPMSLAYHPRLEYLDEADSSGTRRSLGHFPAMVGLIRDKDARAIGVQRIYLTADGKKADVPCPKKGLAKCNHGGAIRLHAHTGHLGIAEGIESAEASYELYGVPTWAAVSSGSLAKFEPPTGVRKLSIFIDVDLSYTGQAAGMALAHRLYDKIEVEVVCPDASPARPIRNVDFLEVLVESQQAMRH